MMQCWEHETRQWRAPDSFRKRSVLEVRASDGRRSGRSIGAGIDVFALVAVGLGAWPLHDA
jgi:hypothetical protein